MKEVEILARIFDNLEQVKTKLSNFEFEGSKKTLDVYFTHPDNQQLQPDKNFQLKNILRLRNKDNRAYLTYKINHFDEYGVWTYADEHEVKISDFNETKKILLSLHFTPLITINNIKHTYLTNKYEIVLEEVEDLGNFIEVERLAVTEQENIEAIKKEIREFLNSLNIKFEELNSGKPELMLQKITK